MTTWTEVDRQSTEFSPPSDEENNYVVSGYVANGYISGTRVWSSVDSAATTWTEA